MDEEATTLEEKRHQHTHTHVYTHEDGIWYGTFVLYSPGSMTGSHHNPLLRDNSALSEWGQRGEGEMIRE